MEEHSVERSSHHAHAREVEHSIDYRDVSGQTVRLVVPWALGLGIMPPPEITFRHSSFDIATVFVYAGSS